MYQVAIIGAGQLGSRHLQGLKSASSPLSITVVDSSEASLVTARARYEAVPCIGEKTARFVSGMEQLPSELDLVIVATGSMPRASIVRSLLNSCSVRYLILEKILFPRLAEYEVVGALLKEKGVKCWVNCPRRMFGLYREIREELDPSVPVVISMQNKDWGLCCNGIHFIDLMMFLTDADSFLIQTDGLHRVIHESKRGGYIEMTGSLQIITPSGDRMTLVSETDFSGEPGIVICNGKTVFEVDEVAGKVVRNGCSFPVRIPYQSQLTGLVTDLLFLTGSCLLTPFELSAKYHRIYIGSLLPVYNEIRGEECDILPIT